MEIKIENLKFAYSSVPVLKDITLDLSGPQFVSIMGPNGVGKSTLIHCINKILTPTEGSVFIDGRDVKDIRIKDLAKEIGYVPYSANDSFPLSVIDTVLMGRHPHSKWGSLDSDLESVYDILNMLDITYLAMRPFTELSAGQHQKVMLARGLAQDPKILLLDEPTSNLDIRHQLEVTKLLKQLSEERRILVIMISHDINIAAKYSDKVIMMHDGSIFDVGTPAEVITEENLRTVYGVEARIVDDLGRPHVILEDAIPTKRSHPDSRFNATKEPVAPELRSVRFHLDTAAATQILQSYQLARGITVPILQQIPFRTGPSVRFGDVKPASWCRTITRITQITKITV